MLSRHGSKRYNVAKNEITWVKKNYGKFFSTPEIVVINDRQQTYRKNAQQRFLAVLPTITAVLPCVLLVTCYVIAIKRNDFPSVPYVPFISELGKTYPANCFFVLGLIISSFLILVLSYLRFKQVSLLCDGIVNKLALFFGVASALSLIFIVSVKTSNNTCVNQVANGIYILFSILFTIFQTYLTKQTPTISSRCLIISRVILTEFIIVSALISAVFLHPELAYSNHPPYSISQLANWFVFISLQIYILTYTMDMRQLYFSFDLWIIPAQQNSYLARVQLLDVSGEQEGTVVTTTQSDIDETCSLKTEV